jgi:osmotically-inducible protein OsmY
LSFSREIIVVDRKSDEGVVTLTDAMPDQESKALAENTVKSLSGVLKVKNDITVQSAYTERRRRE